MSESDGRMIRGVAPVLQVTDVRAALDFYRQVLGFEEEFVSGDPPTYGTVGYHHIAEIHFSRREAVTDRNICYLWVQDADAYHAQVAALGATIVMPPVDRIYGMREFEVEDPSGHHLFFGSRLEKKSSPLLPPATDNTVAS